MRRISRYRILTVFCLGAAATALGLAAVALGLAHAFEAGAAALCGAAFFVPGFLFLRQWRLLGSRELALGHVAQLAEERGVADAKALARTLGVPEADALKVVGIAIREGKLRGVIDARGVFVAASAPRCVACGAPVPRNVAPGPCPSCGQPMAGGG